MLAGIDRTSFRPKPRYKPEKTLPFASWMSCRAVSVIPVVGFKIAASAAADA